MTVRRRPIVTLLTPTSPPTRGGIEVLAWELATRLSDHFDLEVHALEEPGWQRWDREAPFAVRRTFNVPSGGRRSIGRLTAAAIERGVRRRADVVISMHLRCWAASWAVRALAGSRWLQYYHAKELRVWPHQARIAARRADAQIAVSRYTRDLVRSAGAPDDRLHVVPPGVRLPREASATRSGPPTILTVARMEEPYKGHDVLIGALPRIVERVPDVRWVVVGDGALRPELERRTADAGLADRVRFAGRVDDAERDHLLRSSTVFALPSRVPADGRGGEGFGIVYAEAAAFGLPVVAGNEGGACDAVSDGTNGLLVPAADEDAVAGALLSILESPERAQSMGAAGIEFAQSFAWDTIADRVASVVSATAGRDAA